MGVSVNLLRSILVGLRQFSSLYSPLLLVVTDRSASWAGPRQEIQSNIFVTEPLLYQLNFSLQLDTSHPVTAGVILHVIRGEEERFLSLFNEEVESSDWIDWSLGVNINNIVKGADFVELYFEAKPESVNFNLDNVYMERWVPGERLDSDG